MHEFDIITRYFAPLALRQNGALGLTDDAALVRPPAGQDVVITTDAIIAGVHFIGNESPGLIARKLLRVNLSDLAAMGAEPHGYFLALMLPSDTANEEWLSNFARGLQIDQNTYSITLMGGDTTRTPGVLSLTATALGYVPTGQALTRSGAKPGDDIYVTGTIGDAALGLRIAQGATCTTGEELLHKYRLPEPRVKMGQALRSLATSCMDISDGLIQDMGHICTCSHTGATLDMDGIPFSDAARIALQEWHEDENALLNGGDDYELLFTAPPAQSAQIQNISRTLSTRVTRIGHMTEGSNVRVLKSGHPLLSPPDEGYRHF